MNIETYLQNCRSRIDEAIDRYAPTPEGPAATVHEAARYALLGGGKRLRPALVLAACDACGGREERAIPAAVAVEMIHTYSLIHDDLPAMDDDDLRRGRPTVHRRFDEAVAVLAGDALHTLAFEILGTHPQGDEYAGARSDSVTVLARAAGMAGMVAGQIGDIEAERAGSAALDRVIWIHRRKTGALLSASVELGGIAADASAPVRAALALYGDELGLAFQIADDILDCTSTAERLGKTPGKDREAGKATFPSVLGLDESHRQARERATKATEALAALGSPTPVLEALALYAVERLS